MIKKIRDILQSGLCLSDFTDKCKNDGACRKCEDEALEKLIAEHDKQIRADMIDEFKNFIRNNKHYFVGDMAEMLIYEFEQMQKGAE